MGTRACSLSYGGIFWTRRMARLWMARSRRSSSGQGSKGVKQKYTVWVFAGAAFLVTLGITSWRSGLWSSGEPGAQPGGATASHSSDKPNPIPKDPFQAARITQVAPPPAQTTRLPAPTPQPETETEAQPEPIVGNAPIPTQDTQATAPDPVYEQSQEDYKQRAKLMEEIAARARSGAQ